MDAAIAYVPVPVDRLPKVYGLLAVGTEGNGGAAAPDAAAAVAPAAGIRYKEWAAESIAQLRKDVGGRLAIKTTFDLCAAKPDEWISIREVEAVGRLSMPEVRAGLAGLTMLLKHRYQTDHWPIDVRWPGNVAHYRMSPQIARWWRAAGR